MLAIAAQKIASLPFAGVDNGQSIIYVFFTITPTNVNSPGNANPYVAGGDTLDFTTLGDLIKSGYVPLNVTLQSQSQANGFSGYDYYFRPGLRPQQLQNASGRERRRRQPETGTGRGQLPGWRACRQHRRHGLLRSRLVAHARSRHRPHRRQSVAIFESRHRDCADRSPRGMFPGESGRHFCTGVGGLTAVSA
jgi:hypothetical protein